MAQGKILWFNPMKGFGSIVGEDGVSVFVTVEGLKGELERTWSSALESGLPVRYELKKDVDSGELFAVEVERLDAPAAPAEAKSPAARSEKLVSADLAPAELPMRALWTDLGKLGARRTRLGEKEYRRLVFEKTAAYLDLKPEEVASFEARTQKALPRGEKAVRKALQPPLSSSDRHGWFRAHLAMWLHFLRPSQAAGPKRKTLNAALDEQAQSLRRGLRRAFKALQSGGIQARGNFLCCGTCASDELGSVVRRDKSKGGVYWHGQDEAEIQKTGAVYLGFVAGTLTASEVGLGAVRALEMAGLKVGWSGSPGERIRVSSS
jgi:cold shock CspA family protein